MKILNILITNALLATSTSSTIIKVNKNVPAWFGPFRKKADYSGMLPFVEVGFNLQDYIYFQEEKDFDTIIDYIIKSKKINVDKILQDSSVSQKLDEVIEESGLNIETIKETLVEIIATTITTQVFGKKFGEVTGGSSSGGGGGSGGGGSSGGGGGGSGGGGQVALSKANWLLNALGTAAILEWFNREYGEKTTDDMPVNGQGKWEATQNFVNKAKTFAQADDGRLKSLFDDWKADHSADYETKRNTFIGPEPTAVEKRAMWESQSNPAYLSAYETWRASDDAGKGQKVLEPKWRASTSGPYNFKDAKNTWKTNFGQLSHWKVDQSATGGAAKLNSFIVNPANLNQIIDAWKVDVSDDGLDKKAQTWLADVNSGMPTKNKALWYWSNSFNQGVDTWIKGLSSASSGVSDESLLKSAWYFSPDYMDKAKNDKYNDKTTDIQLDAWFNTADGIEAVRHFAANNPKHAISTKFFNFWKSEAGSNYDDASKKWLERVNKEGNKNTLRVKPNKDAWLDQGHDAWNTYKLWAQGPATSDATVIATVRPHLPSSHHQQKQSIKQHLWLILISKIDLMLKMIRSKIQFYWKDLKPQPIMLQIKLLDFLPSTNPRIEEYIMKISKNF